MIYFRCAVQWPFKEIPWRGIWQREFRLTENKSLVLEIDFYLVELVELIVDLRLPQRDCAGPQVGIRLFGLGANAAITDWDYAANIWE